MRLPQSFQCRSLFIRFLSSLAAVALFGILPTDARAGGGQLACNPCTLHFGKVAVGQAESLPATLTNTQRTSVTISAVSVSNPVFQAANLNLPLTLAAGQRVNFAVVFAPIAKVWEGGKIILTSNASDNTLALALGGVGVASQVTLSPNPATVAFGGVAVGTTATLPVGLTNSGNSDVTLTQAQLTGTGFALSGLNLPLTISTKQTVAFNVTFTPPSASSASGSLTLPDASLTIPLGGTGTVLVGQLTFSPSALNFGDVNVGSTSTQPLSMTATGASVTISSSSSSSSLFVLNGASFPLTIAQGQTVSFNVGFTPQTSGSASGTLTIVSNASTSKFAEILSGTGTSLQHTVNLSWNASNSSVAGYNLYRSTSSTGSYSKINSAVEPATAFTDSTVVSGQTYYYAATSVNSSGQESGYSTPVQAVVP